MNEQFPYEDYKDAIEAESNRRAVGVETVVISVGSDDTREGCLAVGVAFQGRIDEGLYENGSLHAGGICVGRIVAFADDTAGTVVVKMQDGHAVSVGDAVSLVPSDYLVPLREFADAVLMRPEARREGRFVSLRNELLAKPEANLSAVDEIPHLRRAQALALRESDRRDFSLLWGPPGTGKSYTLGHMAEHCRAQGKRVLVLSTTNAAVDVATFAIDDACARCRSPLAPGELVRYAQTLTQPDEYGRRPHLMEYTRILRKYAAEQREAERKLAAVRRELCGLASDSAEYAAVSMQAQALLGTLRQIGQRRRDEIAALVSKARILCCTITTCLYNGFASDNFDVVLVDEASQVSLAVWPCLMNRAGAKKFVVAGDPMQLEPVGARDAEVSTQLWFNQNIYAYLGMTTFQGIEPFFKAGAMTLLNEQTRMRRGICDVVSALFYKGMLTGDRADAPVDFAGGVLPDGDVTVLDPSTQGEAYGFDRFPSTCCRRNANIESASAVLRAIREIVSRNPAERRLDILVITPFRDQWRLYASRLKSIQHEEGVTLRATTVHSSQGGEADLVFFDLVNPANPFVARADAGHLWCVACSRAKQKLVVVGDAMAMRRGMYSSAVLRMVNAASGQTDAA